MLRVLLEYLGDTIEVKPGETVVGRDLACQIRLNDPSVSRRHVRLLVGEESVAIEDLGSTNGTHVNGESLTRLRRLADGDELQIGGRTLRVRLLRASTDAPRAPEEDTLEQPRSAGLSSPSEAPESRVPQAVVPPPQLVTHNCPQCRERVDLAARSCPHCGYLFPKARPHAVTVTRPLVRPDRRDGARAVIEIAVLYASDALTFDATARDLSRGGMFVATELLEPVGTPCKLTVLPDGAPAVTFAAVVAHVVESQGPGADDSPAGLGVSFTEYGDDASQWLSRMLDRVDPAAS